MAGLATGFAQGFQMMDGYYNRQDNKQHRQEQLGLQKERMELAKNADMRAANADERAAQSHAMGLQGQALGNAYTAKQINNYDNTIEQQNELHDLNVEGMKQKNADAKTAATNNANDRRFTEALQRYKTYAATGRWDEFVVDNSMRGTDLELLQNPEGADAAIALTKGIETGDIDTVVAQSNRLFKSKLNRNVGNMKGRDGGVIRDITIIDFAQQEDGSIKVPVRVTTDKGTYNSYVSEMRGIDPNDPDKVFSAEDLYGKAAAMGQLGTVLKTSGVYERMQQNANRYLGTGTSDAPDKIQELEYIRKYIGTEGLQNFLMYGRGKSPQQVYADAQKVAFNIIKNDPNSMQLSPEQINSQVQQLATQLTQQTLATNGQGTQQPGQQAVNPNIQAFQQWLNSSQGQ